MTGQTKRAEKEKPRVLGVVVNEYSELCAQASSFVLRQSLAAAKVFANS